MSTSPRPPPGLLQRSVSDASSGGSSGANSPDAVVSPTASAKQKGMQQSSMSFSYATNAQQQQQQQQQSQSKLNKNAHIQLNIKPKSKSKSKPSAGSSSSSQSSQHHQAIHLSREKQRQLQSTLRETLQHAIQVNDECRNVFKTEEIDLSRLQLMKASMEREEQAEERKQAEKDKKARLSLDSNATAEEQAAADSRKASLTPSNSNTSHHGVVSASSTSSKHVHPHNQGSAGVTVAPRSTSSRLASAQSTAASPNHPSGAMRLSVHQSFTSGVSPSPPAGVGVTVSSMHQHRSPPSHNSSNLHPPPSNAALAGVASPSSPRLTAGQRAVSNASALTPRGGQQQFPSLKRTSSLGESEMTSVSFADDAGKSPPSSSINMSANRLRATRAQMHPRAPSQRDLKISPLGGGPSQPSFLSVATGQASHSRTHTKKLTTHISSHHHPHHAHLHQPSMVANPSTQVSFAPSQHTQAIRARLNTRARVGKTMGPAEFAAAKAAAAAAAAEALDEDSEHDEDDDSGRDEKRRRRNGDGLRGERDEDDEDDEESFVVPGITATVANALLKSAAVGEDDDDGNQRDDSSDEDAAARLSGKSKREAAKSRLARYVSRDLRTQFASGGNVDDDEDVPQSGSAIDLKTSAAAGNNGGIGSVDRQGTAQSVSVRDSGEDDQEDEDADEAADTITALPVPSATSLNNNNNGLNNNSNALPPKPSIRRLESMSSLYHIIQAQASSRDLLNGVGKLERQPSMEMQSGMTSGEATPGQDYGTSSGTSSPPRGKNHIPHTSTTPQERPWWSLGPRPRQREAHGRFQLWLTGILYFLAIVLQLCSIWSDDWIEDSSTALGVRGKDIYQWLILPVGAAIGALGYIFLMLRCHGGEKFHNGYKWAAMVCCLFIGASSQVSTMFYENDHNTYIDSTDGVLLLGSSYHFCILSRSYIGVCLGLLVWQELEELRSRIRARRFAATLTRLRALQVEHSQQTTHQHPMTPKSTVGLDGDDEEQQSSQQAKYSIRQQQEQQVIKEITNLGLSVASSARLLAAHHQDALPTSANIDTMLHNLYSDKDYLSRGQRRLVWTSNIFFCVIFGGGMFYAQLEGWNVRSSIDFAIVTLATIGYGNKAPQTDLGRIFLYIYFPIGFAVVGYTVQTWWKVVLFKLDHKVSDISSWASSKYSEYTERHRIQKEIRQRELEEKVKIQLQLDQDQMMMMYDEQGQLVNYEQQNNLTLRRMNSANSGDGYQQYSDQEQERSELANVERSRSTRGEAHGESGSGSSESESESDDTQQPSPKKDDGDDATAKSSSVPASPALNATITPSRPADPSQPASPRTLSPKLGAAKLSEVRIDVMANKSGTTPSNKNATSTTPIVTPSGGGGGGAASPRNTTSGTGPTALFPTLASLNPNANVLDTIRSSGNGTDNDNTITIRKSHSENDDDDHQEEEDDIETRAKAASIASLSAASSGKAPNYSGNDTVPRHTSQELTTNPMFAAIAQQQQEQQQGGGLQSYRSHSQSQLAPPPLTRAQQSDAKHARKTHARQIKLFCALCFAFIWVMLSSIVFTYLEKWRYIDAVYFCYVTLTTIGYGDLYPSNSDTSAFFIWFVIFGLGSITYILTLLTEMMLENQARLLLIEQKRKARLKAKKARLRAIEAAEAEFEAQALEEERREQLQMMLEERQQRREMLKQQQQEANANGLTSGPGSDGDDEDGEERELTRVELNPCSDNSGDEAASQSQEEDDDLAAACKSAQAQERALQAQARAEAAAAACADAVVAVCPALSKHNSGALASLTKNATGTMSNNSQNHSIESSRNSIVSKSSASTTLNSSKSTLSSAVSNDSTMIPTCPPLSPSPASPFTSGTGSNRASLVSLRGTPTMTPSQSQQSSNSNTMNKSDFGGGSKTLPRSFLKRATTTSPLGGGTGTLGPNDINSTSGSMNSDVSNTSSALTPSGYSLLMEKSRLDTDISAPSSEYLEAAEEFEVLSRQLMELAKECVGVAEKHVSFVSGAAVGGSTGKPTLTEQASTTRTTESSLVPQLTSHNSSSTLSNSSDDTAPPHALTSSSETIASLISLTTQYTTLYSRLVTLDTKRKVAFDAAWERNLLLTTKNEKEREDARERMLAQIKNNKFAQGKKVALGARRSTMAMMMMSNRASQSSAPGGNGTMGTLGAGTLGGTGSPMSTPGSNTSTPAHGNHSTHVSTLGGGGATSVLAGKVARFNLAGGGIGSGTNSGVTSGAASPRRISMSDEESSSSSDGEDAELDWDREKVTRNDRITRFIPEAPTCTVKAFLTPTKIVAPAKAKSKGNNVQDALKKLGHGSTTTTTAPASTLAAATANGDVAKEASKQQQVVVTRNPSEVAAAVARALNSAKNKFTAPFSKHGSIVGGNGQTPGPDTKPGALLRNVSTPAVHHTHKPGSANSASLGAPLPPGLVKAGVAAQQQQQPRGKVEYLAPHKDAEDEAADAARKAAQLTSIASTTVASASSSSSVVDTNSTTPLKPTVRRGSALIGGTGGARPAPWAKRAEDPKLELALAKAAASAVSSSSGSQTPDIRKTAEGALVKKKRRGRHQGWNSMELFLDRNHEDITLEEGDEAAAMSAASTLTPAQASAALAAANPSTSPK